VVVLEDLVLVVRVVMAVAVVVVREEVLAQAQAVLQLLVKVIMVELVLVADLAHGVLEVAVALVQLVAMEHQKLVELEVQDLPHQ
jgi:hypothetical protein